MLRCCSAGGIKSNVGPLVAEQYVNKKARVSVDSDGRRVIIDPDITVQTIFSRYYWSVPSLAHEGRRVGQLD
jgi:POT family proton-dependent oligopeptide transporter